METRTNRSAVVLTALTAALVYGCATEEGLHQSAVNARSAYQQATQDGDINQYAKVKLYEAELALQKLNNAIDEGADPAEIEHLSYLVQERIDIANATAQQRLATAQIDQLNNERAQIRLDMRTAEVERAKERADMAAMEAEQAKQRASSLEQRMKSAGVRQEQRGIVISLGDVFFDFNKASLKAGAKQDLDSLAQYLKENPDRNVVIEGYTDNIGPAAYNEQLSHKRAQAVVDHLASQGISHSRLVAHSYGESFPVATNESSAGRQLNRRVEVVVLGSGQQPSTARRAQEPGTVESVGFSELDKDHSGYLAKKEAQQIQALSNNFEQYDQNSDQQINRAEFAAFEEVEIQHQQMQRPSIQPQQ